MNIKSRRSIEAALIGGGAGVIIGFLEANDVFGVSKVAIGSIVGAVIGTIMGLVGVLTDKKLVIRERGTRFGARVGAGAGGFVGFLTFFVLIGGIVGLTNAAGWLINGLIIGGIVGALLALLIGTVFPRRIENA